MTVNHKVAYVICIVISVIIIADFLIPGKSISREVVHVSKDTQQHYNASGNQYFTYRVYTEEHDFYISADSYSAVEKGQIIEYRVSYIFGEVNSYQVAEKESSNVYSLRGATGLLFPVLVLLMMSLAFKLDDKMGILIFVVQVLLLADVIYLLC